FANKADYDLIREDDLIDIEGLTHFSPGSPLFLVLRHNDGSEDRVEARHSYSDNQIEWFKAGGALNLIRKKQADKA
ncbi:MAG: hypothetical protein IH599_01430, partial [Bacteroidales bacterium]|nr:hypothetical protein [Bacteroidales bacterium]